MAKIIVDLSVTEPNEDLEPARNGGQVLRDLCRKEVDSFDEYLKNYGGDYTTGLAHFERMAIEGFLYQKIRGHLPDA